MNIDTLDPALEVDHIFQSLVPEISLVQGGSSVCARQKVDAARNVSALAGGSRRAIYLVDEFFNAEAMAHEMGADDGDSIISVSTATEPSNTSVDTLTAQVRAEVGHRPAVVVGFGGGITMDSAKAVSNLLTNGGAAESYQGWDLLRVPGIRKIGVPTISGTGAESSRTCVISNANTGAKLGMNSKFSLFDSIILDPALSQTVPRNQYFFTGMDTYMHGIESLRGRFRNPFADGLSRESVRLVRNVFSSEDMMSHKNRRDLMIASCFGGMAIAGSYVGLIHPMSAALSMVFGIHHGIANCMVMRAMDAFYPEEFEEFWRFVDVQQVDVPFLGDGQLTQAELDELESSTLVHERPLSNALGKDFRSILGGGLLRELFSRI